MTARTPTFAEYIMRAPTVAGGTTSNQVTDLLRNAILDGVFDPGAHLREVSIAKDLKVSRTPVRDALRTLAAEGLLTLQPNKGAVVSPLTTDDVIEIYTVREALEGLAARLASRRASSVAIERLDRLLDEMQVAADGRDLDELVEITREFHRVLNEAANNRYLARSLDQIADAMHRFAYSSYELPGRVEESLGEHREILEAIRRRDPEAAERLSMEHISRVAKIRLQMLVDGY